ncbi:hypothetical protein [Candidatus Hydrogenosomobacter endosymbioticus]|uniref:Uncharacterized protein n=1 Tax=Candidatus Hydrogenosomobacter endosymbioticus TaxID=2558174 RepID=A0ABM7V8X1_9PROT|nr:hypothetical protein [Candidatus Hydrogenosomobacter endosymbioticus]BDB96241.1 hypothetical protein HYD_3740 [Candidatus Hydrogenosomobacter endosymbioticus]
MFIYIIGAAMVFITLLSEVAKAQYISGQKGYSFSRVPRFEHYEQKKVDKRVEKRALDNFLRKQAMERRRKIDAMAIKAFDNFQRTGNLFGGIDSSVLQEEGYSSDTEKEENVV